MNNENQEITKQEIKKEFQLERMILFSDAVFAIVITLMAIEIHLPETEAHHPYTEATFITALKHIFPTIFAYGLSFFFIGLMWYKHLQMFSLLKDYNQGLIVRNLIFLFFIGLFPFGASLIIAGKAILLPPLIYFIIIMLCMGAQLLLHHYILNSSTNITINIDFTEQRADLRKRILSLIAMASTAILAYLTYLCINKEEDKQYAIFWMFVFIIIAYKINKKKSNKPPKVKPEKTK